jgi:hypothetical protein
MPLLFSRSLFFSFTLTLLYAAAVSAASLTGRVIDPDGRPASNPQWNDEEALGYPAMPRTGTIGVRIAAGR